MTLIRNLEAAVARGDLDQITRALDALREVMPTPLAWMILFAIQLEQDGVHDRAPFLQEGWAALVDLDAALGAGDAEEQRRAELRMQRAFRRRVPRPPTGTN